MVNASVAANKQVVSFIVRVFVAQLRGIDSQFIPALRIAAQDGLALGF